MYSIIGIEECINNLYYVISEEGVSVDSNSLAGLKFGYNRFLSLFQKPSTLTSRMLPELVSGSHEEKALLSAFIEPVINIDNPFQLTREAIDQAVENRDPNHIEWNLIAIEDAYYSLKKLSTPLGTLCDLMINKIFCTDIPGDVSASTLNALGVLWINFSPRTTIEDWIEVLVHELIHQLIFIDSHIENHYTSRAMEVYGVSAICGLSRPLPCVFDSLLVSLEILNLRRYVYAPKGIISRNQIHPSTATLLCNAFTTIESIKPYIKSEHFISFRGKKILQAAIKYIKEYNYTFSTY